MAYIYNRREREREPVRRYRCPTISQQIKLYLLNSGFVLHYSKYVKSPLLELIVMTFSPMIHICTKLSHGRVYCPISGPLKPRNPRNLAERLTRRLSPRRRGPHGPRGHHVQLVDFIPHSRHLMFSWDSELHTTTITQIVTHPPWKHATGGPRLRKTSPPSQSRKSQPKAHLRESPYWTSCV